MSRDCPACDAEPLHVLEHSKSELIMEKDTTLVVPEGFIPDSRLLVALDLAQRLTQYTLWKSMNQLRRSVKDALTARGLQDQLKRFKLKQTDSDHVTCYLNPRYM